jgi:hypothetical protein
MNRMIHLCSRGFGMPYDYKGFDQQPTTFELQGIARHIVMAARVNVPADYIYG